MPAPCSPSRSSRRAARRQASPRVPSSQRAWQSPSDGGKFRFRRNRFAPGRIQSQSDIEDSPPPVCGGFLLRLPSLRPPLHSSPESDYFSRTMKLTIIQTGEVPEPLRAEFGSYSPMFVKMFESAGASYDYEAILLPGSAAGVYDDHAWLTPLRHFIRGAYAARTPMVGVCFGHQIMADALGGDVRKSEQGW